MTDLLAALDADALREALSLTPGAWQDVLARLGGALLAGGAIGLERSYHGRPAGFRTHTLVSLASATLMLVTVFEGQWFVGRSLDAVRVDPTRMAQGIVTGIGFLGAGVIFKEGLSVRGLTTAASIWITSAIGVLMGVGLYGAAYTSAVMTLGVLTVFRQIERRVPTQHFAAGLVRFGADQVMPEAELRALLREHGFRVVDVGYRADLVSGDFEYRLSLWTHDQRNREPLALALHRVAGLREFALSSSSE
ncbi:MAG: MgtC/SapB family protein [Anaeromyxobacter sp.]